jgi:3'(2'), 5'-bisphosphate nucleotidase
MAQLDLTNPETRFAVETVRDCALLARAIQAGVLEVAKDDRSPVTVADFALQAIVGRALESAFPADALVAEESSDELRQSAAVIETVCRYVKADAETVCRWVDRGTAEPGTRFWVLDPIDGTKGYLRGGQYAVAFSLVECGAVRLGVLGCPSLGEGGTLAVAVRGGGAWATNLDRPGAYRRLHASREVDIRKARLLRSFEASHTNVQQIDDLVAALGIEAAPVLMDSQAKFVLLADGSAECMLRLLSPKQADYREKIWDIAAGAIVIEEAGGTITDLAGSAMDYSAGRRLVNNRGVCATNGPLHPAFVKALREF